MNSMKIQSWLMASVAVATLTACTLSGCRKDADQAPDDPAATFDRATLLADLANNVIVPSYAQLNTAVTQQQQAVEQFVAVPDMAGLQQVRTAWNTTMDRWMACELFRFGPQYDQNLGQRIAYTPLDRELVESEISGSGPIDAAYIANAGVTRKGLHAMEHLLYGSDGNADAVLAAFANGPNAERRRTYLASISADIAARIGVVDLAWRADGGNHAAAFRAATQSDINGSLNVTVNAWIENLELVRRDKVQVPSGIDLGGTPAPEAVENRASGRSIANIVVAIEQWKRVLSSGGGLGIDDNLNAVNAEYQGTPLAAKILQECDNALANCAAITVPLDQAVVAQPAQVSDLYLTLKRLTVLCKIDMASNLGVIITFSDNDGD